MSKLIAKTAKPRNPLVAPARFRQAGQHGSRADGDRREGRQALKRELHLLAPAHDARGRPPRL